MAMIESEERLRKVRLHTGVQWHVLERDYLMSWILAGVRRMPLLHDTLVFKGGTALRKCYFENYRFSEDLDFTGLQGAPTGKTWSARYKRRAASLRTCWKDTVPHRTSSVSATSKSARIRETRKLSGYRHVFHGIATRLAASRWK